MASSHWQVSIRPLGCEPAEKAVLKKCNRRTATKMQKIYTVHEKYIVVNQKKTYLSTSLLSSFIISIIMYLL